MEELKIRIARPEDAQVLLEIYAHYVRNTAISFECVPPSAEEFRGRIEKTLSRYPYIVAEYGGETTGYAYLGPFHAREAYARSAETSIYVRAGVTRGGTGRRLYAALESIAAAQGIVNLYACIGLPETEDEYLTFNSVRFHEHMGYTCAGVFHGCGRKFGRWYGMMYMEKLIGEYAKNPSPFRPFPELDGGALAAAGISCIQNKAVGVK